MSQQDWLIPPQLFAPPPAGGWLQWGLAALAAAGEVLPDTMAVRSQEEIAAHAPAVAQAQAVQQALAGELNSEPARQVRERFRRGEPLCLLPWPYDRTVEAFVTFEPVLRRLPSGQYQVGAEQSFGAPDDAGAFSAGLDWFLRSRQAEIARAREAARQAYQDVQRKDPILASLLAAVLERDGLLGDDRPEPLLWRLPAHGWWRVDGQDWRYGFRAEGQGATALLLGFYFLALRAWQTEPMRFSLPEAEALLGPAGWSSQGTCHWQEGSLRGAAIIAGDRRLGMIRLAPLDGNRFELAVLEGNKVVFPTTQVRAPSREVALAWLVGQVLDQQEKRR